MYNMDCAVHCPLSAVWYPLPAVCCPLSAIRCLLSVVCCPLSAISCLLSAVCYPLPAVRCLLSAACCLLSAACCPLSAVCYPLPAVRCLLSAIRCLLSAVCCLLSAVSVSSLRQFHSAVFIPPPAPCCLQFIFPSSLLLQNGVPFHGKFSGMGSTVPPYRRNGRNALLSRLQARGNL